jgi:hypothetical protein
VKAAGQVWFPANSSASLQDAPRSKRPLNCIT